MSVCSALEIFLKAIHSQYILSRLGHDLEAYQSILESPVPKQFRKPYLTQQYDVEESHPISILSWTTRLGFLFILLRQTDLCFYFAGWSLYDKIKLKRTKGKSMKDDTDHMTLGELLKKKAREGVRVCLLIWDDKTSLNNPLVMNGGLMMTHDEDTRRYFRNTKVRLRQASKKKNPPNRLPSYWPNEGMKSWTSGRHNSSQQIWKEFSCDSELKNSTIHLM